MGWLPRPTVRLHTREKPGQGQCAGRQDGDQWQCDDPACEKIWTLKWIRYDNGPWISWLPVPQ